jgi:hypothetical protein
MRGWLNELADKWYTCLGRSMQRSLYIVDVCAHPNFREGVERKEGIYVESRERRIGTLMGGAEAGGFGAFFSIAVSKRQQPQSTCFSLSWPARAREVESPFSAGVCDGIEASALLISTGG